MDSSKKKAAVIRSGLDKLTEEQKKELETFEIKLEKTLTKRLVVYNKIKSAHVHGINRFKSTAKELKSVITTMVDDLKSENEENRKLEAKIDSLQKQLEEAQIQNSALKTAKYQSIEDEETKKVLKEKDDAIDFGHGIIHKLKLENGEQQKRIDELEEMRDQMNIQNEKLKREVELLKEERESAQAEQNSLIKNNNQLISELKDQIHETTLREYNETGDRQNNGLQSRSNRGSRRNTDCSFLQNYDTTENLNEQRGNEKAQRTAKDRSKNTYAQATINGRDRERRSERIHVITVQQRPTSLKNGSQIYEEISELLKPLRGEVEFENIVKNKNEKTIIKYKNEGDKKKILDRIEQLENEVEINSVVEKRRIMIKSIPKGITKNQIVEDLNSNLNNIKVDEKDVHVKNNPDFYYQRAIIVLNAPEARDLLNRSSRVVIGFKACPIERDTNPLQCYNCGGFGHSAYKNGKLVCRNIQKCIKCGSDKHEGNCDESRQTKCLNCKLNHSTNSKTCQVYLKVEQQISDRW